MLEKGLSEDLDREELSQLIGLLWKPLKVANIDKSYVDSYEVCRQKMLDICERVEEEWTHAIVIEEITRLDNEELKKDISD